MGTTRPPILPDPEKQAQEVAEQLTENLGRSENLPYSRSRERPLLLGDVEFAMEELHSLLLWVNTYAGDRVRIPCVQDREDTVPIIGLPISASLLGRNPDFFLRQRQYPWLFEESILRRLFGRRSPKIVWSKPSEAPEMVLSPLRKFLAVRFQWIADNPEFRSLGAASSMKANNPYLPFTVRTKTHGLRIHYSTTFAINFNNVFGAPTSPLNGWILPGIHKFAGMDSSGSFYYDRGTFTTPPDFSAKLMI
jgi:hypothetical protein